MANRADIRTKARDLIYEASADLWTDNQLNRALDDTLRELPRKGIYLEKIYTDAQVIDQIDYALNANTIKVEKVEINAGTSDKPSWLEIRGWDQYQNALYLRTRPSVAYTMRIHCKNKFTILTDDSTATDVPDDKLELVAAGVAYRAFKMLMGYFVDANNWDSIAKPDGVSMNQVARWIQQSKTDYDDLLKSFRTVPRPRSINLVD